MVDRYVAVVGGGICDDDVAARAEEVGRLLAGAGAVVVCGGLGGVMEAVCRGARGAGGRTVGILPGRDRRAANAYVDVAIATGLGEARNTVVVGSADCVIAIGGEYGTLSEIGFALKLGKPVVALDSWRAVTPVGAVDQGVVPATSAEEAVRLALSSVPDSGHASGPASGA